MGIARTQVGRQTVTLIISRKQVWVTCKVQLGKGSQPRCIKLYCLFFECLPSKVKGFPGGSVVNNPPARQERRVPSLGQEDPLEKEMATHSSIFAWEIPWTEEPGGLQSMGSQRVGHNLVTKQQ